MFSAPHSSFKISSFFTAWKHYFRIAKLKAYCSNNPINRIDRTGLVDIYIYHDGDSITSIVRIDTGENEPNRLYIQDLNADENTENRKEHEGDYFMMVMIPSSEYEEEDYRPGNHFPYDSRFDKDRNEYIWGVGINYTDSRFYQRWYESFDDDPESELLLSLGLTRGKKAMSLGFKSHRKGKNWQKHSNPRSGGDPEKGGYGINRNTKKGDSNKKYIAPQNPNKRPKKNN